MATTGRSDRNFRPVYNTPAQGIRPNWIQHGFTQMQRYRKKLAKHGVHNYPGYGPIHIPAHTNMSGPWKAKTYPNFASWKNRVSNSIGKRNWRTGQLPIHGPDAIRMARIRQRSGPHNSVWFAPTPISNKVTTRLRQERYPGKVYPRRIIKRPNSIMNRYTGVKTRNLDIIRAHMPKIFIDLTKDEKKKPIFIDLTRKTPKRNDIIYID